MAEEAVDLEGLRREAAVRSGVIWTLEGPYRDLNVNLVRFPTGEGVAEHVNEEVDVLLVGASGEGAVAVEGVEYELRAGVAVLVDKGKRRSITSNSEDFSYLSIHRRRGPINLVRKGGER